MFLLVILVGLVAVAIFWFTVLADKFKIFVCETELGRLNVLIDIIIGAVGLVIVVTGAKRTGYAFIKQLTCLLAVAATMFFGKIYCFERLTGRDVLQELRSQRTQLKSAVQQEEEMQRTRITPSLTTPPAQNHRDEVR